MLKDIQGLTSIEVEKRINEGLVNIAPEPPSRSTWHIVRANVFNIFNAINVVFAGLVILAGSPKNTLFAGVILTNSAVGVYQELKARSTLKKLSLINKHSVKVIRDGTVKEIPSESIVVDDILVLEPGRQVPADGVLLSDESLDLDTSSITGESDPEKKEQGSRLLSGSIVMSGHGCLKVEEVGAETYISKLSSEAKEYKLINSELRYSINKIIKIIMIIVTPLGIMLMLSQMLFAEKSWQDSLLSTVAGIVSMIPEGLVLLTTLTFLMGVVRLARWNTLVQELPATEVLARVDTLCLDKTGTITEGVLKVSDSFSLGQFSQEEFENHLSLVINAFKTHNPTHRAVLEICPQPEDLDLSEKVPFSSDRKWSGVRLKDGTVIILGAPEVILKKSYDKLRESVEKSASEGKRVLLLAISNGESIAAALDDCVDPCGLILLEDKIRDEAASTLAYFKGQGVDIKIISGDNPVTVSSISKKAGVIGAEKYVDASTLSEDKDELARALSENVVFGRVTPHQKRDLVSVLQDMGRTVAMTGDGVNDVLALKKSDCGIALSSGSEATKSVAQLVLLDSDFSNLPHVVSEGRRIINNLERVSGLYLAKTVYSIVFAFLFTVTTLPYPFEPIQLTLVGALTIGIPSFFLALSLNFSKVKSGFLFRVISITVPKGLVAALLTFAAFTFAYSSQMDESQTGALCTLVLGGVGLVILAMLSKPVNKLKAALILTMGTLFALAFYIKLGRYIFSFAPLDFKSVALALVLIAISYPLIYMAEIAFEKGFTARKAFSKIRRNI